MDTIGPTGLEGATVVLADGTVALRESTLLAEPGELLAVLGPSGSGKSSLLRAIAGLERLSAGRIVIAGSTAPERGRRGVAMVAQDNQLIPFLDAARNMSFPLDVQGVPREESRARVEAQASRLRIGRLLGRKPPTLSPGEKARVGLGRAMIGRPSAYLLDEPLAHLDASERVRMRQQLRAAVKEAGVTTFLVTHDPIEALSISDRVAVLDAGRVVQVGTGRELYDAPVNRFVAELVAPGRITLVPARLVVTETMCAYRVGTRTLPTWTPPPPALRERDGDAVLLGIRPEDVHAEPAADHGTADAIVRSVELVGPYTTVGLDVAGHDLFARFPAHSRVRRGDAITVGIDAVHALVFDAVTGAALTA
ncbi:MAG TPA: ABC transporter ATP-binding protein [Jatrophihabitans sp.]|uniref:ABC transporter ATP-binding protein n=1 Tax=Jatrophihabitans sp. TaxID=1932789 RepID=UPI002DFC2098|nr:ABC transporter ATP-binding protein [Jatrophihabitans sp.]